MVFKLHKERQQSSSSPKQAMPSSLSQRCTIPIVVVLAIGCVVVVAAFTGVTTYTGITFSSTVEDSVHDNLNLALRSAMQAITEPLTESEKYIDRLRAKIEHNPSVYAVDDADTSIATNPSLGEFYLDTMAFSLQRPDILYIYEIRQSSRYYHGPGHPTDTVVSVSGLYKHYFITVNNTYSALSIAADGNLSDYSTPLSATFPNNESGADYIAQAYATADKRWDNSPFVFEDNPISNLMTIYAKVRGLPGGSYALGLDIDMVEFGELTRQATPPFTIGVSDAEKKIAQGAHTSLYDISETGFLMTTSAEGVILYKSSTELWPAGQTPSSSLNTAYNNAIALCNDDCGTTPRTSTYGDTLVSIVRHRDDSVSLNLLLVSSIPRHYFFVEADRSLYVSIGVATACCVLVIVGCVLLVLCITPSLRHLKINMLLAADLKNDRVEHTNSFLSDIADLSSVFDEMNKRLLVARSFVPEAVLLGHDTTENGGDGSVDDEEGSHDEEAPVDALASLGGSRVVSQLSKEHSSDRHRSESDLTSTEKRSNGKARSSSVRHQPISLNEKRISVLSLNLVGFNGVVDIRGGTTRQQRINDVSAQLLSIVVGAAQRERGVMDSFHGDHFILTFNASRAVGSALSAAIRTASTVEEEVQKEQLLQGSVGIAAGAAVGKARIGTLGIEGYRRLSIIGPVYRNAITHQGIATEYLRRCAMAAQVKAALTAGCFVDEGANSDLSNCGVYMQLIGRSVTQQGTNPVEMYAAHSRSGGGVEDEWLYELDAIEAGDPFTEPNRAVLALMNGDEERCKSILKAHTTTFTKRRASSLSTSDNASPRMEMSGHALHPAWSLVNMYVNNTTASMDDDSTTIIGTTTTTVTPTAPSVAPFHYIR